MSENWKRRLRRRLLTLLLAAGAGGLVLMAFLAPTDTVERSPPRPQERDRENEAEPLASTTWDDSPARNDSDGGSVGASLVPERQDHRPVTAVRIELVSTKNRFAQTHLVATMTPPHFKVVCDTPQPRPIVRVLAGEAPHPFIDAKPAGGPVAADNEFEFSYALTSLDRLVGNPAAPESIRIEVTRGDSVEHIDVRVGSPIYEPQLSFMDRPREDGMVKVKAFATISDIFGIADLSFSLHSGDRNLGVSPHNAFIGGKSLRDIVGRDSPIQDLQITVEFWAEPEWRRREDLWARFQVVSVRGEVVEARWKHVDEPSD